MDFKLLKNNYMYVKQKVLKIVQFVGNVTSKEINLHARPNYPSWYPESEYSSQRSGAALKLGGRKERGKERIL